jgi:NitT/TauT family transport system substrate-binding protein
MKQVLSFVYAALAVGALSAMARPEPIPPPVGEAKPAVLRAAALNGPSSIPLAYLFETPPVLEGVPSEFVVASGPDTLLPRLLKGEVDLGILPINLAAKVYTANHGAVLLAAIVGEGMISLVTRDPGVTTLGDLRGKQVHVAGQGATPDYMFRYILQEAGIPVDVRRPDAVILDYSLPPAELPAALLSGKVAYAVIPEPFATVVTGRNSAFRRAIDFQAAFAAQQNAPGRNYPVTALVVRADFAAQYPGTVRRFLSAYAASLAWTNANPEMAGVLVEENALGLAAPVAAAAIPHSAFVFQSAVSARSAVEHLLGIFLANDAASVGGAYPNSGFYFE